MTIAPPARTARHDARRGIRRPHHPPHRDGRDAGGTCTPELAEGPVGVRRGPAGYGPGLVDGRRDPRRLAAAGRSCPPSTARPPTTSCTTASAPRRRPSATASSSSATSTSATRSSQHADFVGRLVPARERARRPARRRGDRVLRRALHGRDRRHALDARAGRDPAEPRRRLLDGRHGRRSTRRGVLGAARRGLRHRAGRRRPRARHPRHLHELVGRAQGLLRRATAASSAPRRTPTTVLEWAFERGQRVLFFPDQHLGRNTAKAMGVPLEQMPMWNPRKAARRQHRRASSPTPGSSSGTASARVHKRFTVDQIAAGARRAPRRARHRAPRVPDGGRRRGRRRGLDRLHREGHRRPPPPARPSRSAPRSTSSSGSPPSTRSTRSSASTPSSARARRCTASTPATSPGCSRSSSRASRQPDHGARRRSPTRRGSPSSACSRRSRRSPWRRSPGARARARARGPDASRGRSLTMSHVLVVGSGIAGLLTAVQAADAGHKVDARHQGRARREQHALRPGRHRRGAVPRRLRRAPHRRHARGRRGLSRPRRRAGAVRRGARARARPHPLRRRVRPRRLGPGARPRGRALARPHPARRRRRHGRGDRVRARRDGAAPGGRVHEHTMLADLLVERRVAWSAHACSRHPATLDRRSRRRGRARDRRQRMPLPAHHEPRRRDGRRGGRRPACRRGRRRPRVRPVPPHGARGARHSAGLRGRARRGRRAASTRAASGSCSTSIRAPSSRPATSWRARSGGAMAEQGGAPGAARRDGPRRRAPRAAASPGSRRVPRRPASTGRREPVPGHPRRALLDGRRRHRPRRAHDAARPVRGGRDRLHRRARREPARLELAARGGGVRRPRGARARRRRTRIRARTGDPRPHETADIRSDTPVRWARATARRIGISAGLDRGELVDRAALQALMWEHVGLERERDRPRRGIRSPRRLARARGARPPHRRGPQPPRARPPHVAAALARTRERRRALPLRRPGDRTHGAPRRHARPARRPRTDGRRREAAA